MRNSIIALAGGWLLVGALGTAQADGSEPDSSPVQGALNEAARQGQYSFVLFYKQDGQAVQEMIQALHEGLAQRPDSAPVAFVQVNDPAEQALVARFNISRAPMPLTIAVAPNGAVTGMFARGLTTADVGKAFVTPGMMRSMKAMQEGRLVIVGIETPRDADLPDAVREFEADPQFKDRLTTVSLLIDDPNEAKFLSQMKVDPARVNTAIAVVLAPPGVMIGTFDDRSTAGDVAAAVHKAGQCCDDPNCKHNRQPPAKPAPTARSR